MTGPQKVYSLLREVHELEMQTLEELKADPETSRQLILNHLLKVRACLLFLKNKYNISQDNLFISRDEYYDNFFSLYMSKYNEILEELDNIKEEKLKKVCKDIVVQKKTLKDNYEQIIIIPTKRLD